MGRRPLKGKFIDSTASIGRPTKVPLKSIKDPIRIRYKDNRFTFDLSAVNCKKIKVSKEEAVKLAIWILTYE